MINSGYCESLIEYDDWTNVTLPSWMDSILEGIRRPGAILSLGLPAVFKGIREIPTILLMRWAFSHGLMRFGVFRNKIPN